MLSSNGKYCFVHLDIRLLWKYWFIFSTTDFNLKAVSSPDKFCFESPRVSGPEQSSNSKEGIKKIGSVRPNF